MHIYLDPPNLPVSFGWLAWKKKKAQYVATFIVKGTYVPVHGGPAVAADEAQPLSGDSRSGDRPEQSLRYASDFVPMKARADVLLGGTIHAPGGRPVKGLVTELKIGPIAKQLQIVGTRRWRSALLNLVPATDPEPFMTMPLTYENAYGGPAHPLNPVGKGMESEELPNVEIPGRPVTRREMKLPPAGFGPLSDAWTPRKQRCGTFGAKWLKESWPGYPEDMEPDFFNAAPADQQVEGYLRGDEVLRITNMHPDHPSFETRLPGTRLRLFLNEREDGDRLRFREVPLCLDTLFLDMDGNSLSLVWRGSVAVRTVKLKEVQDVVIAAEPLGSSPRPGEHYRERLEELSREEEPEPEAAAAEDPAEGELREMEAQAAEADKVFDRLEAEMEEEVKRASQAIAAAGVDPAKPLPDFDHAAWLEMIKEHAPELAADMEVFQKEVAEAEKEMAAAEQEVSEDEARLTREQVVALAASGASFAGRELPGLDLSQLDLRQLDFSGANLRKVNLDGARLQSALLVGAFLSGASLRGTDFEGARMDEADLRGAAAAGSIFRNASLHRAILSKLDLTSVDLSGCTAVEADFSGSNLTKALLRKAVLHRADFTGATLQAADFSEADLESARLEEVRAAGILLRRARAKGIHASDGGDFTGAACQGLAAPESIWNDSVLDGADFSQAILTRARFDSARACRAVFDRAALESAAFDDAVLRETSLRQANLLRASFDRSDLSSARLDGSNLYEASFPDASLEKTVLSGANLKGTMLRAGS